MQLLTHALRQLTTAYYQAPAAGRGFMQRRCPSVCPFVCLSVCCLKLGPVTGACPAYRPPRVSHVRENFPLVQVMLEAPVSYIVSSPVNPPPLKFMLAAGAYSWPLSTHDAHLLTFSYIVNEKYLQNFFSPALLIKTFNVVHIECVVVPMLLDLNKPFRFPVHG